MDITYRPYIDPDFEVLIERIHPPRVCIDNDTYPDCTLVKVDSANKQGMLLDIVQVLTDLDLVISKSYISSDGGWLMDVFHATDQQGNKITDESLIHNIEEGICASRRAYREIRPSTLMSIENTALEVTGMDRPGLMSEMSAVLVELGCRISAAMVWTHNSRAACIIYVEDDSNGKPITDPCRVAQVQAQLENVVEAHHYDNERRSVRLTATVPGQTHTERRLHQLMVADGDYEMCSCCGSDCDHDDDVYYIGHGSRYKTQKKECYGTHVKIEKCNETGYSIVTVRSRDRPKLLFDTVCTLTDMQYIVFHAAISSKESIAVQEYYVRHRSGRPLDSEDEKHLVTQCLIAATERRISHGLKLDICTENRTGLLSDITRVFRENGLSITRAEIGTRGERAVGTFYVKDTSGQNANPETLETVRREIGSTVVAVNKSLSSPSQATTSRTSRNNSREIQERPRFSLGSLLWSHLERISSNFRPIKS
ncbi:ACT domain-containing protein ACR1 [Abeliophyllum distichum]|uniref:ACT domain-containing protein ACR n=1 Tax=Abeliophyllum distichum TaxID=126358 RepID=A0ABD1V357_9LAMI